MFLFTKPKASQGQGYLRIDKNLWFYDPSVGKWERRTERERIGGTNSRRSDFDESRLAQEYDPEFVGEEKLGAYTAIVMNLKGKPGIDLAFPTIKLWVDKDTNNVLKRQEFALSGKLLRTAYYPKWKKVFSESSKADIYYPEEIRMFDEMEKANQTLVVIKTRRSAAAGSRTCSPRPGSRANRDERARPVAGGGRAGARPGGVCPRPEPPRAQRGGHLRRPSRRRGEARREAEEPKPEEPKPEAQAGEAGRRRRRRTSPAAR